MCTRPLIVKDDTYFDTARQYRTTYCKQVPCGKCPECLKDRQNSWKLRLVNEASCWKHLYFFTLTYSNDSVPRNHLGRTSSSVSDIQNWLKRFRTNKTRLHGSVPEFKYFICAEYAPSGYYINRKGFRVKSSERPHYHGLIFSNQPFQYFASLFNEWSILKGFVDVNEVALSDKKREERSSVANYVSKYCCKGEFASRKAEIERGEIERAFSLMSKGIGGNYVKRYRDHHLCGYDVDKVTAPLSDELLHLIMSHKYVNDGEFRYRMPRYYQDRIYRRVEYKEQEVYNVKKGVYEVKFVKRFTSNNLLSRKMALAVQERILERLVNQLEFLQELRRSGQDVSPYFDLSESVCFKESRMRSKLSSFYQSNANKHSFLCLD